MNMELTQRERVIVPVYSLALINLLFIYTGELNSYAIVKKLKHCFIMRALLARSLVRRIIWDAELF
jgi:hypothetical protein